MTVSIVKPTPADPTTEGTWGALINTALDAIVAGVNGEITRALAAEALLASLTDSRFTDNRTPVDGSVTTAKIASGGIAQSTITGLTAALAALYTKPGTGIPASDLATAVQTAITAAGTAYQKPGSGIPSTDLVTAVQTALTAAGTAVQPAALTAETNRATAAEALLKPKLSKSATRTATFTAVAWQTQVVDISGGSFPGNLPAANSVPAGTEIPFKVKAASTSVGSTTLTVTAAGADTINGAGSTLPLRYADQAKTLVSDGTSDWTVIGGDFSKTVDKQINDALYAGVTTSTRKRIAVSTGFYATAFSTAQTTAGTSRVPFYVANTVANPTFKWSNAFQTGGSGDTDNATALPITACLEIAGVNYPLTFGGALSTTVGSGGVVESDQLGVTLTPGIYYVRTYTSSTSWYPNHRFTYNGTGGFSSTGDLTAKGAAAIANTTNLSYGITPIAMYGIPLGSTASVLIFGDSIAHGQSDAGGATQYNGYNDTSANLGRGGFIARALAPAGIGCVNIALPGELLSQVILTAQHFRRFARATECTSVIDEYGRNDLTAGQSLATLQANTVTAWAYFGAIGLKVYRTTVTPATSSTDGFITTTNQTPLSAPVETVRVATNTWLRDGAPLIGTAPQAVGTTGGTVARCAVYSSTGTLVTAASGPAHPVTAVFDVADAAESARNSGVWKAPVTARTVTDAVTTAGGFNVTSATAAFTSADLGRTLFVQGAGASGAVFITTIAAINSSTSVGCIASATTAVSAATATLYDMTTQDGTHPQSYGSGQLGPAINTAVLG